MKYLFIIMLASNVAAWGMEPKKARLERAFNRKRSDVIVFLCKEKPELMHHLKALSEAHIRHGEWGLRAIQLIKTAQSEPTGRIHHDHHPLVQKEQQKEKNKQILARL